MLVGRWALMRRMVGSNPIGGWVLMYRTGEERGSWAYNEPARFELFYLYIHLILLGECMSNACSSLSTHFCIRPVLEMASRNGVLCRF